MAHLDLQRAAAAIAVVLLHAVALYWATVPLRSGAWLILAFLDSAVRWCVPMFFMITGALFLTRSRPVTPRLMITRSIPRLLVAFSFWSVAYNLFEPFQKGRPLTVLSFVKGLPRGYYHLWFLPVMMGLYLLMPVLWHIFTNRALARYLVVLWAALVVLGSTEKFDPTQVLNAMATRVLAPELAGYAPFVLLGGLLATCTRTLAPWQLVALFVLSTLVIFALTVQLSWSVGHPDGYWFAYLTPAVCLASVAVFCAGRSAEGWLQAHPRLLRGVRWIGDRSFGIYLVHPMVMAVAVKYSLVPGDSLVLRSLLLCLGALVISLGCTIALRRIPRLGDRIS